MSLFDLIFEKFGRPPQGPRNLLELTDRAQAEREDLPSRMAFCQLCNTHSSVSLQECDTDDAPHYSSRP